LPQGVGQISSLAREGGDRGASRPQTFALVLVWSREGAGAVGFIHLFALDGPPSETRRTLGSGKKRPQQ
jgi:hypothetical protein